MDFVCTDPNAEVRAANVRGTLDAFKLVPSYGERLVARHRLEVADLTPDKFVPVQRWLDALKEIQSKVGTAIIRDVGTLTIENAHLPPAFGGTADEILLNLNDIYKANHRGNVGRYVTSRTDDGAVVIRCETPYPRHFEWGLIEGICRNNVSGGRKFAVDFEPGPPDGDLTCIVTVRWPDPLSGQWRRAPTP